MDDFVDAYRVLGVEPSATQDEVKAAHRALARRHHPDLAAPPQRAAADLRLREINVAYGLVRSPESRKRYDRVRRLHAARQRADRARGQIDDAAWGDQWEALSRAAGRWAGTWMRRSSVSYRAGRALGRLLR